MNKSNVVRGFALLCVALLGTLGTIWGSECPGEVRAHGKIAESVGGFSGTLDPFDFFGVSSTSLGDLDGNGVLDLAIGAPGDDDGGVPPTADRGAVWIAFMNADGTVASQQKISDTQGGFTGILGNSDFFGASVSWLGDLGSCAPTPNALAVGAYNDDDGGSNRGAVWILFLNTSGTVVQHQKISSTSGGLVTPPINGAQFSYGIKAIGDQDGDGVGDLAVGAILESGGGAMWLLLLNCDGTVKDDRKIAQGLSGFTGDLDNFDWFGSSAAPLGDLDGDGNRDLAVGAPGDDDGSSSSVADRGAIWILFMDSNHTVKSQRKISDTRGMFLGNIANSDFFGASIDGTADLDGDGVTDLVAGTRQHDEGGSDIGAVWVLFLNSNGTVKAHQKINHLHGGFDGVLGAQDNFGYSVAVIGDLDDDGVQDVAVGALYDDDGSGANQGAVWLLQLDEPLKLAWNADSLYWGPPAGATNYDIVYGSLDLLLANGSFATATEDCLEDNLIDTTLLRAESPDPGQCHWFLVRRVYPDDNGTYGVCAASMAAPRDLGIQSSGVACP